MKKLYVDIGTNKFQGFDQISSILAIDDSWHKIFIEPNPEYHKNHELMSRMWSIKNSRFYNCALDTTTGKKKFTFLKDQSYDGIDQGGSLHLPDREFDSRYTTVEVNTMSFYDIIKDYTDGYEWYLKFDCENCEYDCLLPIVELYHEKIKWITCEFHGLTSVDVNERELRTAQRNQIMNAINKYKIAYMDWH